MRVRDCRHLPKPKGTEIMNTTTKPESGTDLHEATQLLLPWYMKDALDADERQQVERHVRTCLSCRRELLAINKLAAAVVQSTDLDVAAHASFANIRDKLQIPAPKAPLLPVRPTADKDGSEGLGSYTKKTLAKRLSPYLGPLGKPLALAATVLLAMLPLALQDRGTSPTSGYYTLSDNKPTPAPGVRLHVVFAKDLPESHINQMLASIHGQRVGGPNSVGAYTVQLDAATGQPDAAAAIAFLHQHKEVLFAEPALEP